MESLRLYSNSIFLGKIRMAMMKVMIQRFLFSILLLMLIAPLAFATSQDPDILIYNGKTYNLFSNPLEDFYGKDESKRPKFWIAPNTISSGNWRGYVATWEIIDDKLYLTKIDSWFCRPSIRTKSGCRRVTLRDLFGKKVVNGRVSASWLSGKLRVPDGKQLKYVHSSYASIYERDIILEVNVGKIINQEIIDNTKHPLPSDQEIYQQELERLKEKAVEEKRVNSTSSTQQAKEENEPVFITNNGWGKVSLGAKRKAIEAVLGQGEYDGRKYENVYFVEYPKKGIQISYTNKNDEAYTIFFYNKQKWYGNFVSVSIKTDKGITWSSSPDDVIRAYGKPPRDFSDDTGKNIWRRLEYNKMDFLFEYGRMTRIGIHTESCTGCEKQSEK